MLQKVSDRNYIVQIIVAYLWALLLPNQVETPQAFEIVVHKIQIILLELVR